MAPLRDALKCRKLDALTAGLTGPPRHFALRQRVLEAVLKEADAAAAKAEEDKKEALSSERARGPRVSGRHGMARKLYFQFMLCLAADRRAGSVLSFDSSATLVRCRQRCRAAFRPVGGVEQCWHLRSKGRMGR